MSVWQSIVKWFIKYAWPEIQEFIKRLIPELLNWVYQQVQEVLDASRLRQAGEAEQKAQAAQQRAEQTTNAQDAEHFRKIAEVWQKVADDLRQENERLKEEVSKLFAETNTAAQRNVSLLTAEDVFEIHDKTLSLKKNPNLTLLPSSYVPSGIENHFKFVHDPKTGDNQRYHLYCYYKDGTGPQGSHASFHHEWVISDSEFDPAPNKEGLENRRRFEETQAFVQVIQRTLTQAGKRLVVTEAGLVKI